MWAQVQDNSNYSRTDLTMLPTTEMVQGSGIVLERIVEVDLFAFADVDEVPVDDVGEFFMEDGAHGFAAEIGAGVGGGLKEEVAPGESGQALLKERSAGQAGQKRAGGVKLVVLEVKAFEPGIAPGDFFRCDEGFEKILFGDPIDLADEGLGIVAKFVERAGPGVDGPFAVGIELDFAGGGGGKELFEDVERGAFGAVGQLDFPGAVGLMGEFAHGADRFMQGDFGQCVGFEQIEHEGGGADFEGVAERKQIGVAQQEVKTAKAAVIGQRFIAGVDQGAVELDPLVDVGLDEIGALGNLVGDEVAAVVFAVTARREGHADAARPDEEDARGQEGEQGIDVAAGQWRVAMEQVILMTAKGGAGVVVDVVFDKGDFGREMEFVEGLLEENFTDLVVGDDVGEREALGGAVFDVAHVEVKPSAVEEEAAVAGGLVVVAVVQVDQADFFLFEEVVAHPGGHGGKPEGFGGEATVFGFQAGESLHDLTVLSFCASATGNFFAAD